jgi:hypothetical protein
MIGGMIAEIVVIIAARAAIHGRTAGRRKGWPAVTSGNAKRKGVRRSPPAMGRPIEIIAPSKLNDVSC